MAPVRWRGAVAVQTRDRGACARLQHSGSMLVRRQSNRDGNDCSKESLQAPPLVSLLESVQAPRPCPAP